MISENDKSRIVEIAGRYKAKRVLLFGSSVSLVAKGNDIDLAVEGVPASEFFNFYGELLFSLSKPIDLIDLAHDSKFTRLIRKEGILLYG